ncbi:hypothetical protein MJA45_05065 [Paenibacillus aurantius]|uniref:Uncharacterized protein n=1 Tax=Paenibacillus aurantius TaxID=2918900 RepID=A0AA96LG49_9BACL|nr:hypothetical protein [Paenibacillus aurantius]WJH37067.1 hypothetical protein N6H14_16155 [Paenibacillus sp. CC-CFT747]WNQ12423.1 hypothetical protein MJA45_05065 [Paenibacillus aurantius]
MSIERFIMKKLSRCKHKQLRANLLQLLVIRIQKAQEREALAKESRQPAI